MALLLLATLALLATPFALYATALHNPLLLDDHLVLETHPDVLQPEGLTRLWKHNYWEGVSRADRNLYRPLTILSFHIDALRERSPASFRIPNVLLLGLLGALLWHWLRAWKAPPILAWAVAIAVVAHPLQASVINYVVGRADLLSQVGILGFLFVQRRSATSGWGPASSLLALLCASLAVGSKEGGVCVVALALVQEWCIAGRGARASLLSRGVLLAGVPVALYLVARLLVVGMGHEFGLGYAEDPVKNPLVGLSFLERAPASMSIAWFYASQLLWPDPSFWHVPDRMPSSGDGEVWLGALLVALTLLGLIVSLRRRSPLAIPLVLVLLQFTLVGQALHALAFYAANRQAGPFLIALGAACVFLARRWAALQRGRELGLAAATLLISGCLLPQVFFVNANWTSDVRMAEIDLGRHPDQLDSLAANASANLASGRYAKALEYGAQVVERRPEYAGAWLELGMAHLGLQQPGRARKAFLEVLRFTSAERAGRSYRAQALYNLAGLAQESGNALAAERFLVEAATIWPSDLGLLRKLAALAQERGAALEAARRCAQLLEHHPGQRHELWDLIEELLPQLERIAREEGGAPGVECAQLIELLQLP